MLLWALQILTGYNFAIKLNEKSKRINIVFAKKLISFFHCEGKWRLSRKLNIGPFLLSTYPIRIVLWIYIVH